MNLKMFFKLTNQLSLKIILVLYIISFIIGTYNHVVPFIIGGLHVYQLQNINVPNWLNYYWSSLGILDPLAIIILSVNINRLLKNS